MIKTMQTVLALGLLVSPGLAWATVQGDGPQIAMAEVVVTATRSEEDIKSVPAKVEVINTQAIEQTVGATITEQLKKNSSVGVIEYPGALAGIGMRGFRPEFSGITKHTLILLDGHPAGATNLATILSDNIARIEVLKGPASSLYGGEAMGGVVNIITKKNTKELTGQAEVGFGSFQTNFQKAALGGAAGSHLDFDISARRYDQLNDFTMGNGENREHTSYKTQNGSLRLGGKIGETWRLDVSGNIYQGRDIETPGDTFVGNEKSGRKDIDRYGVDLRAEGEWGANNIVSFSSYRSNETSESYKNYTGWSTITQVPTFRSYDTDVDWLGAQLKDEYSWRDQRFIIGVDYQDINKESRSYNQDGTRKAPYAPDEGRGNWAGYLETIWKFMDKRLTATAGGRYDSFTVDSKATPYKTGFTPNSETFSTFSPRAGLNYLFDRGARLHTTIGKAFVPPTAAQLAGYSERVLGGVTMITKGNANLDPESSLTYDLGAGYDKAAWGLSLDVTYFHTDVDDKISTITIGNVSTYENRLSAEMDGLETMLSFDLGAPLDWQRSLTLFVNSTHLFSAQEEQSNGTMKDIHNVAKYTINYGISYNDGMVDGKLSCRNQGKMKDTDWNAAGYPEVEYPSFSVVDLMVGMTMAKHHRLTLRVDNLFDKYYYEKKGYPKPGQSFFVSYAYRF